VFAVLTIVSMVGFRGRIYARLRGHAPQVRSGPLGEVLTLPSALAPGESCQVEHAGTFWTVRNGGNGSMPSGARARITGVQGLILIVQADA